MMVYVKPDGNLGYVHTEMDPTLSWNGPFLFTRHRSANQRQATRDRSVMVPY